MNIFKKIAIVLLGIVAAGALASHTLPLAFAASTLVTVVNTVTQPVPVSVQHKLQHQGTFFNVGAGGTADLVVPAGVVLTDAHLSFSVPAPIANAASLFI